MKRTGRFSLLLALLAPCRPARKSRPILRFPLHDRYVVAGSTASMFGADASLTVKRRMADNSLYAEGDAGCGWWIAAVELGGKSAFRVVDVKNTSWECPHAALEESNSWRP